VEGLFVSCKRVLALPFVTIGSRKKEGIPNATEFGCEGKKMRRGKGGRS